MVNYYLLVAFRSSFCFSDSVISYLGVPVYRCVAILIYYVCVHIQWNLS